MKPNLRRRVFAAWLVATCPATFATIAGPASADPIADCMSARPDDAISGCSRIIGGPSPAGRGVLLSAYHDRGLAYAAEHQWGRALDDLNKVIELSPGVSSYYLDRGKVLLADNERDRAFADFDQAIRLLPENSDAYLDRGLAHQSVGDLYEALGDYEAALRLLPEGARKDSPAAAHRAEVLELTALAVPGAPSVGFADGRAAFDRGDYATARRIWFTLADQGDVAAEIALGNLYWTGKGNELAPAGQGTVDAYGEAAKWYRKAGDQHVADAELKLGQMYRYGLGVPKDAAEAVKHFVRATARGNEDAGRLVAALKGSAAGAAPANDPGDAITVLRPRAEGGDPNAEFDLARRLLLGGDPKKPGETRDWLRKSADQGNPKAQFLLATFYVQGADPTRNDEQAAAWLRSTSAQLKNGLTAYERGDFQDAVKLLTPVARFGDASAQTTLGEIYEGGKGVARDFAEALKWYRLAADQGDVDAGLKVELGNRFSAGIARYVDGDYGKALSEFDEALKLDRNFADAYDLSGWAYSAEGARDRAVMSFGRARELRLAQGWVENDGLPDGEMRVVIVRSDVGCKPDCPEWISAEGRIVATTVNQFKRVFKEMGDKRLPIIIQSPGGDVQAAFAIGRLIRAKKLDVAIGRTAFSTCLPGEKDCPPPKGGYRGMAYSTYAICASACPLILAAGDERLVGNFAAAAVHQIKTVYSRTVVTYEVKYQMVNGRKVTLSKTPVAQKSSSSESVKLTRQQELQLSTYLKDMGIDQSLIAIMTATPYTTVHRLTPDELDRLHMITKPAEGEVLIDPKVCTATASAGNCEHVAAAAAAPGPAD